MRIAWKDRNAREYVEFRTPAEGERRLAYLEADEQRTQACAPTDSGDVRFNYKAEAKAIRAALADAYHSDQATRDSGGLV